MDCSIMTLQQAQDHLKGLQELDYNRSMSDDFWYSNPSRKLLTTEIDRTEARIRELQASCN